MSFDFTANEIFEMAIRIEGNGAAYYKRAAELQNNEKNKTILSELAAMEDTHKETFVEMKKQISQMERTDIEFEPDEELIQHLVGIVDSHGGEGDPDQIKSLTGQETITEILTTAIELEKETVLFYLFFREWLPPEYGQMKLDEIIKEEQKHIIQLTNLLKEI